ncbi:TPA: hypothetical protein ACGX73_001622 [Listeria monocytogenes]|nr:hypothetical protein [Listeria monocytogenes]
MELFGVRSSLYSTIWTNSISIAHREYLKLLEEIEACGEEIEDDYVAIICLDVSTVLEDQLHEAGETIKEISWKLDEDGFVMRNEEVSEKLS